MLKISLLIAFLLFVTPQAAECSVPIRASESTGTDDLSPRSSACVVSPGLWLGNVDDDTVKVWVTPDGAAVDSVKIILNNPNCINSVKYELTLSLKPPHSIQGDGPPDCVVTESVPCIVSPPIYGRDLTITFETTTSGTVELFLVPPGESGCKPLCQELEGFPVPVEMLSWGRIRAIYR